MTTVAIVSDIATISVSRQELKTLYQALNEVINGLELDEFAIRMGATVDEAHELMTQIRGVLNEINARS